MAFLVGNANYNAAPSLENPTADVGLISKTLKQLDFEASEHLDLDRSEIANELSDFLDAHSDAGVTLFYFPGHGMQFEVANLMVQLDQSAPKSGNFWHLY